TLATVSRKQPGFPFGSLMPYGLDDQGRPIFLISSMAMHTQNLQADPRASLLIAQLEANSDPLGSSRITLIGNVQRIPEPDVATMTAVDRLGFNVRLKTHERIRGARIAFLREVSTAEETRKVLVEMVRQARNP